MFGKYFNKFILNLIVYGFGSLFLAIPFLIYYLLIWNVYFGAVAVIIFVFVVSYGTFSDIVNEITKENNQSRNALETNLKAQINYHSHQAELAKKDEALARKLLAERASGFPTLFQAIDYYERIRDSQAEDYLRTKPHPAFTSAELVKEESRRRREAEFIQRKTQSIIEYYENIAPFLLDFKEQELEDTDESLREYTEEEAQDPVTKYLTKEEYRKLPSIERNQMALDRYWSRPNKPKWLLGRIYERYVGYIYEAQGYQVDYTGIIHGYEDLGRDLICKKGKEIIIIQCKYWSQFKTIFEKHIFQFFGTVFQYRDKFPSNKVGAIFYTTTELSDLARRFAGELKIDIEEKFKMPKSYPCIKCNISQVDGTKIYHMPFDQQYDNTLIETSKGEFYCESVKEAEEKGFRRAFRWKGQKLSN